MASSLTISHVDAGYAAVRVLEDVSFEVRPGETVALLGTNGNGKSTLMKSIMGIVRPSAGKITATIDGVTHELVGRSTEEIVDLGIAFVPEGRRLFPKLTVTENLLLGAFSRSQLEHRAPRPSIRRHHNLRFRRVGEHATRCLTGHLPPMHLVGHPRIALHQLLAVVVAGAALVLALDLGRARLHVLLLAAAEGKAGVLGLLLVVIAHLGEFIGVELAVLVLVVLFEHLLLTLSFLGFLVVRGASREGKSASDRQRAGSEEEF